MEPAKAPRGGSGEGAGAHASSHGRQRSRWSWSKHSRSRSAPPTRPMGSRGTSSWACSRKLNLGGVLKTHLRRAVPGARFSSLRGGSFGGRAGVAARRSTPRAGPRACAGSSPSPWGCPVKTCPGCCAGTELTRPSGDTGSERRGCRPDGGGERRQMLRDGSGDVLGGRNGAARAMHRLPSSCLWPFRRGGCFLPALPVG